MFNDPIQEEATITRLWEVVPPADAGIAERDVEEVPAGPHGEVVRGSAFLVANLAIGAIGSFVYWVVLARLEPPRVVGTAAGLATVLMFLNYATSLGLPVVVPRYASGRSHQARVMFCWALLATSVASVVGVLGYDVLAPGSSLRALEREVGTGAGLAVLAVLLIGFSLGVLVDARLLTLRSWGWLTVKTVVVMLGRFPLLMLRPTTAAGAFLFIAAMLPTAVTGFAGALALGRGGWRLTSVPTSVLRTATRFAGVNYVGLLALQAPMLALPLIVSAYLNKPDYATFFVAFSITTVVFLVPTTIGQVLLAEGGTRGGDLAQQVRLSRRLALGAAVGMVVLSPVMAATLRLAYGPDYLDAAYLLLPLVAAVLLWAVAAVYLTEARIGEHTGGTLTITGAFAAATLLPALILVDVFGLRGVVATWIIGNIVVLVAAVLVHHQLNARSSQSPSSANESRVLDLGRGVMSDTEEESKVLMSGPSEAQPEALSGGEPADEPEAGSVRRSRTKWAIVIALVVVVVFVGAALLIATSGEDDSTAIVDTFERSGSATNLGRIPDGPPWNAVSGEWEVSRGSAVVSDPGVPASLAIAKMPAEGEVTTEVGQVVPGAGLVFRYQSPASYWKIVVAPKVLTWQICKVENNQVRVVGNTGQFSAVDDHTAVSVRSDGQSIEVLLNGRLKKTVFDSYLASATGAGMVVTGPEADQARFARFSFDPN